MSSLSAVLPSASVSWRGAIHASGAPVFVGAFREHPLSPGSGWDGQWRTSMPGFHRTVALGEIVLGRLAGYHPEGTAQTTD